ncbi:MAG: VOC family protein [Syntrophorhabdaceae bacterium]
MKLDHIGFVVEKIDKFTEILRSMGFSPETRPVPDYDKNVNASFIPIGEKDATYLEILEPLCEDSAIYNFLKKTGGGLHHLCFEVENIAKVSDELEKKGFKMVSPPTECTAYDENLGRDCASSTKISFFLLPGRLLIELLEKGR